MRLISMKRDGKGTSSAKRARNEGLVPGVLYGDDIENIILNFKRRDIEDVLKTLGGNAIVDVVLEDDQVERALLKEVQRGIIKYDILHIDLQKIDKDQLLKVFVPITIIGDDFEIDGGVLEQQMDEIEIEAKADNIPRDIEVDVSKLGVGDSILVSDIVADGFEVLSFPDEAIVTVTAHVVSEDEDTEEVIDAADVPEVSETEEDSEEE